MRTFAIVVPFLLALPIAAQRELLDDLPADADAWTFRHLGPEFDPVPLPGDGSVTGLARIGEAVWLGRGDRLWRVSLPGWQVRHSVEAPAGLRGLCAGPRFVYALVEDGIAILDPIAGRAVGTIECAEAPRASVIGWHEGRLLVGTKDRILARDGKAGEWVEVYPPGRRQLQWLVSAGGSLWGGTRAGLVRVGGEPAADAVKWSERSWPWVVLASAAVELDGRLLFVADTDGGEDRKLSVAGLLSPVRRPADEPGERLTASVLQTGEKPRFEIGPKPLASIDLCRLELERLAADPQTIVRRPDGSTGLLPVVIKAYPNVRVRDLASFWDAITAAGFDQVCCPPVEAWVLAERQRRAVQERERMPGRAGK